MWCGARECHHKIAKANSRVTSHPAAAAVVVTFGNSFVHANYILGIQIHFFIMEEPKAEKGKSAGYFGTETDRIFFYKCKFLIIKSQLGSNSHILAMSTDSVLHVVKLNLREIGLKHGQRMDGFGVDYWELT